MLHNDLQHAANIQSIYLPGWTLTNHSELLRDLLWMCCITRCKTSCTTNTQQIEYLVEFDFMQALVSSQRNQNLK